MEFWKTHPWLRIAGIAASFVLALVLIVMGWGMTGKPTGLGLMILGVALLLTSLSLYNRPFQDSSESKK